MASLGDMVVRIRGDMTDFNKAIDATETKFKAATANFQKLGMNLTKFVTLPILGIGAAAVKAAADMEIQEAAFETMLGSAEKAKTLLTDLNDLAAKTPFQLTDLANATKTMLAFGIENEKVLPNLRMLGDIAGGDAEKLRSLTLAFSQIQSTGRLMGQDLLQLINAGFNPLQIIAEKTGKTMAELKKDMENGAISADMVSDAFKTATSEGGRFFGGMERASLTLKGQFSTLLDNMMMLGRGLGDVLLPPLKDLTQAATQLTQKFTALDEPTRTAIVQQGLLAAAIGPVILGVLKLIEIIPKLMISLTTLAAHPVIAAMIVLGATLAAMATNINKVQQQFKILDNIMSGGSTGDVAEDMKIINKELDNLYASQAGSSGLFPDEDKELQEQINKLETIKKQMIDKERWAAMNVRGQVQMNKEIDKEVLSQDEITKSIEARARVTAIIGGRKNAEIETDLQLEALNTKINLGLIEKNKLAEETREIYLKEIDALINLGYALDQLDPATGRVSEGAKRLAELMELIGNAGQQTYDNLLGGTEEYGKRAGETLSDIEAGEKALAETEQALHDEEMDRIDAKKVALSGVMNIYGQLGSLISQLSQNEIEEIEQSDDARLKSLNDQLALAEGNAELEKAIEQEIQDVKAETARKIAEAKVKQAKWDKAQAIADATINTIGAAVAALKAGPILGPILAGVITALGLAQVAAISAQPLPAVPLAEGGVVMPTPGGTLAQIAEAGQPEAVIPLDRFGELGGDIHLVVNLDSKPFLDKIFPATRNRTILISAGAVV